MLLLKEIKLLPSVTYQIKKKNNLSYISILLSYILMTFFSSLSLFWLIHISFVAICLIIALLLILMLS